MPHVAITMFPGRDDATKKELALKVQECLIRELNVDKKVVSVSIEDIPKDQWEESMKKFTGDILFVPPGNED